MRISDWSSDVCSSDLIELLARRTSSQIQTGMTLGKPLAQYFGLSSLLDELRSQVPDFAAAGVVLSNGQELASVGTLPDAGSLMQALLAPHSGGAEVSHLSSGAVSMSNEQGIQLAVPLMLPDGGGVAGAMVLRVTPKIGRAHV